MLTLVPTPIGNLSDLSPRALEVLKQAAAVYCEDTRRTRQLLTHFEIRTPTIRYQDRDPRGIGRMLERLRRGENLALVSDAGSPVLSDPGRAVVAAARAEGLSVLSLPGPFAAAVAVAGSGLPGDSFVFLGFLPRSSGKQKKMIARAAELEKTIVIYESPFRIVKCLAMIEEALHPRVQIAVARELSKLHEEWATGTLESVRKTIESKPPRGEYVVVLHPKPARA